MGAKLDDRELFKRLAKPGEQFNDDWVDALHEKVRDEGVLVGEKQWNSDNPGAGANLVEVYAFEDLFFVDDDSGIDGAYETFSRMAALSCFPVTIVPLDCPSGSSQLNDIRRGFVSRVALILGCMELSRLPLVVAFESSEKRKAIVADALAGASAVVYLTELDEAARAEALRNTARS